MKRIAMCIITAIASPRLRTATARRKLSLEKTVRQHQARRGRS
jgi:hypothetical protein